MRLDRFVLYTALGAGLWCAVLTAIGWVVGKNQGVVGDLDSLIQSPEFGHYSRLAFLAMVPLIAILITAYVLRRRRKKGAGA